MEIDGGPRLGRKRVHSTTQVGANTSIHKTQKDISDGCYGTWHLVPTVQVQGLQWESMRYGDTLKLH